jgi:DNA-binding MarR family transcriptional regulator
MHYTFENYKSHSSVGYLVKRCGVLIAAAAEKAFVGQPLSFTQWIVLINLRAHGGPLKSTQLSEKLGHDAGALTRVIDSLERQGLVTRERSQTDRRAVAIALTAAGLVEAENALHRVIDLQNELLEPFSSDEVETLTLLLQRLQMRLQDHTCSLAEGPE